MAPTAASLEALSKLRQLNPVTGWYVVTLLVFNLHSKRLYSAQDKKEKELLVTGFSDLNASSMSLTA